MSDGAEVLVESFLRGLVVHRANAEHAVDTFPVGGREFFDDGSCAVASASQEQGHPTSYALDECIAEPALLVASEGRCLGCGAHDAQEVDTILNLIFDESDEGFFVDTSVCAKRRDERYAESVEFILCHCVGVGSKLAFLEEIDESGDAFQGRLARLLDFDVEADAHTYGTAQIGKGFHEGVQTHALA